MFFDNRKKLSGVCKVPCLSSLSFYKQMRTLLTFIILGIFLISFASALNWDNVKQFEKGDKPYGKYTIKNSFGFGETIAEIELLKNTDKCGEDCSAEKEIVMKKEGVLIDSVKFLWLNNEGEWEERALRSYRFLIRTKHEPYYVDDYSQECKENGKVSANGTREQTCSMKKVGQHTEYKDEFEEYTLGSTVPKGTYYVKLEGQKRPDWTYDWIIVSQGKVLDDWSVWAGIGSNFKVDVNVNLWYVGVTVIEVCEPVGDT
jgi:hypothetical protein